jgi:hypothetical protein
MPTLEATLNRLAIAFTVRDIMTANVDLVCAVGDAEAGRVSDDNPDFDVIPVRQDGNLIGYFERRSRNAKRITPSDLISDGTSLLDLVEILEDRQFSFVLSRQRIEGYVHFSDLNHQLVLNTRRVVCAMLSDHLMCSSEGQFKMRVSAGWFSPVGAGARNLSPPGAGWNQAKICAVPERRK